MVHLPVEKVKTLLGQPQNPTFSSLLHILYWFCTGKIENMVPNMRLHTFKSTGLVSVLLHAKNMLLTMNKSESNSTCKLIHANW